MPVITTGQGGRGKGEGDLIPDTQKTTAFPATVKYNLEIEITP